MLELRVDFKFISVVITIILGVIQVVLRVKLRLFWKLNSGCFESKFRLFEG